LPLRTLGLAVNPCHIYALQNNRPDRAFAGLNSVVALSNGTIDDRNLIEAQDPKPNQLVLSIGLVTAFWLAAVSRWIVSDTVVPWDSKNQFYAFFRFLSAALHAGDWPFWNPYHYGGHPSVSDPQSLIFSPIFFAWGAFQTAPTMRAFDLVVLAHLLAGGIAIATIGWRAHWPVPACVMAAALFMFGGAASGRLQHTGIILSYSLFPVALLLLQLALERCSHRLALGFAIIAVGMALGRSQVALLLCGLLLAGAAAEIMRAPRPSHYLRQRSGVLTTTAILCAALMVVPMLLTLQFADLSNRPAEALNEALRGSLYPANLATLAIANIFGTHESYWGPGAATLGDVALTDDSFNYLFVGSVPVLLLLWLGVAGGSAWRPGRRLMTGTLVIACLFMLGRYTPLYSLAFRFVPGIDLFRRPTDASLVFGFALAVLVGHCLADYVRAGLPRFRPLLDAIIVSAWLGIVGSAVVFSGRTGHALRAGREAGVTVAVMLIAGLILLGARRRPARLAAANLVTLIALTELLCWNAASRLNAQNRTLYAVLEAPTGPEAAAIALLETSIAADHRRGDYPRVEVLGLGGPWQNLAMVRGWEATNGYNPLRIGLYDRLVAPGEQSWAASQRQFPPSFAGYDSPLANALGLTYLVLGERLLEHMRAPATQPAADLLLRGPPVWIYRFAGAMPRARLFGRVQQLDGEAMRPEVHLPIAPSPSGGSAKESSPGIAGAASIELSRPGRVEVVATSTSGGLLVLHDTYYPGWLAEVDGRPASILRAFVLFRGVEVPPGTHRITFRFAPFSFTNLRDAVNAALAMSARRP
jgi:hypothetical protein